MRSLQGNIAFHFETREQRVKAVNFDVCKQPQKLIDFHSDVPWTTDKIMLAL